MVGHLEEGRSNEHSHQDGAGCAYRFHILAGGEDATLPDTVHAETAWYLIGVAALTVAQMGLLLVEICKGLLFVRRLEWSCKAFRHQGTL